VSGFLSPRSGRGTLRSPAATWTAAELERHIIGLAIALFTGVESAPGAIPATVGAAYTLLALMAKGAFGRT